MKRLFSISVFVIVLPTLISCSSSSSSKKHVIFPEKKNIYALNALMTQYSNNLEQIWGNHEMLIPAPQDYIRYSEDLKTRSHTNFEKGMITIETLEQDQNAVKNALKLGIMTTLLMGDDGDSDMFYSISELKISSNPLLVNQIKDQDHLAIQTEWRAARFADYILNNQLKKRRSQNKTIYYVTIQLNVNHIDERAQRFMPYINSSARKYRVDPALILAIAKVESSFNPHAVSPSNALGLMQIQPHTAGRDLYRLQGKKGEPSRAFLLNPKNNIEMGAAYIAMLRDVYLSGIKDKRSQYYAIIAAYNGGAGSVLRVFSKDKEKAFDKINQLSSEKVYQTLIHSHPSLESRRYLEKVHKMHGNHIIKK